MTRTHTHADAHNNTDAPRQRTFIKAVNHLGPKHDIWRSTTPSKVKLQCFPPNLSLCWGLWYIYVDVCCQFCSLWVSLYWFRGGSRKKKLYKLIGQAGRSQTWGGWRRRKKKGTLSLLKPSLLGFWWDLISLACHSQSQWSSHATVMKTARF